ncbi:ADP-ribosylglycohydrolase family protein [Desulfovibrio mangrovi]|uniref:ADP-ribosylglycohydrolase family protein n=1 Tax=Desulfovibrio mangrovi TaxID=2976983 RepID=UPI00224792DA|nr:ADP-ribosylglycohydrolase family protein [Desulfovibrio mangrovi]UZP66335.1 ADP-ribosylglycohydrolase family protein [Desulfovibrio mangrovi]
MPHLHAALLTSLAADSLALGAHWEYDQKRIEDTLGRVSTLLPPKLSSQYHPTRSAGDLSHYGDQVLVLLDSVTAQGRFDLHAFRDAWLTRMQHYDGYLDRAIRETLRNLEEGALPEQSGAHSSDFSAAARIAPLFAVHMDDLNALVAAARAQTLMTHNSALVADGAEFFARAVFAILQGATVREGLDAAAEAGYKHLPAEDWLAFTYMSSDEDARMAIARFGQSCGMKGAFHGVVHLVTHYENEPQTALIENVMAGGDSCARGLMAGLILGARHGEVACAPEWCNELNCLPKLKDYLSRIL